MNIVRLALHRPYTFLVLGIAILLLGLSAILRTPTDIFPNINIPVVTVVWYYDGLNNNETEKRITTYSEFSISFFVNDIRTIESQTIPGLVVEKIYFQPDVNVDLAMSQVVSATNSIRAFLPPGAQPPIIMQYSASTVPVLQLALSSDRLSESELYDYGVYRIRQQLAPIPGTMLPPPLWRPHPPGDGRYRPRRAGRQGHYAARCLQRDQYAEPLTADGRREIRRQGLRCPHQ